MDTEIMATLAGTGLALYVGHHVGDYWVQTDHQAQHKGKEGHEGRRACTLHVLTYLATQLVCLLLVVMATGMDVGWELWAALVVSGGTHYAADRREYGLMFRLARLLPGKAKFMTLGVPREPQVVEVWGPCPSCQGRGSGGSAADESTNGMCWDCRAGGQLPSHTAITDNPSLGTGAWALDQSWHLFFGVFVPALILALG